MQEENSMLIEGLAMCCDLRTHRCDQEIKDTGQRGFLILQLPEKALQSKLGSMVVKESNQCPK